MYDVTPVTDVTVTHVAVTIYDVTPVTVTSLSHAAVTMYDVQPHVGRVSSSDPGQRRLCAQTQPAESGRAHPGHGDGHRHPLHLQQERYHSGRPGYINTPSTFNKSAITLVGLVTPTPPPPSTRALSLW